MNKKVKNANKNEKYGLKFDSNLELFFYEKAIEFDVRIDFKKYKFQLTPSFSLLNNKFRPMTWQPDFYLPDYNILVDTKGYHTSDFKLKFKIFCYMQMLNNSDTQIIFVKNKKEVTEFLNSLTEKSKVCEKILKEDLWNIG